MFSVIDKVLDWASERTVWVALSFFTLGVLLVLISMWIHGGVDLRFTGLIWDRSAGEFASVTRALPKQPLDKNVSYAWAPNWGLYGAIILPLIVGLALRMRTERLRVLETLAKRGMLRDSDFMPLAADTMLLRWHKDRRIHTVFLFIFAAVVLIVAAWDWYSVVILPTYFEFPAGVPPLTDSVFEFDWSLAHLMPKGEEGGRSASQLASVLFSGVAYLLIAGLGSAIAFVVMIDATLFILFTCGLTQSGPANGPDNQPLPRYWSVVPAADKDDDSLCGFRIFAGFLSALLCASLAILTALLLMVLQNSYLRDPGSKDIIQFIFKDFKTLAETEMSDYRLSLLIESHNGLDFSNPNAVYAILLTMVVAALSLGVSWLVLRKSAEAGRDTALENVDRLSGELSLPAETIRERLKAMTFWPLGWVSLGQAMTMVGFMIVAFLSLRLMLLPLVLLVAWLTARMVKNFAR